MNKTLDIQFRYLCEFSSSVILTAFPSFNLHSTPCKSVHVCVFVLCEQRSTVFPSWINPGQCLRGLQVNVAYFKRLFLHGRSVSEAHLHTDAFWDKDESQQRKKACGCGLCICLFCILFNQQQLVSTFLTFTCLIFCCSYLFFLASNLSRFHERYLGL